MDVGTRLCALCREADLSKSACVTRASEKQREILRYVASATDAAFRPLLAFHLPAR
jgi:hypothetical protein